MQKLIRAVVSHMYILILFSYEPKNCHMQRNIYMMHMSISFPTVTLLKMKHNHHSKEFPV